MFYCNSGAVKGRNTETENKKFICGFCEAGFNVKQYFTDHLRLHGNPDLYKCSDCSKKFTCKRDLQYHKVIHTNPGAFKCSSCDKSFEHKHSLKRHMLTHEERCKNEQSQNLQNCNEMETSTETPIIKKETELEQYETEPIEKAIFSGSDNQPLVKCEEELIIPADEDMEPEFQTL